MERRRLIGLVGLGLALTLLPSSVKAFIGHRSAPLTERLLATLQRPASAARIGHAYLATMPAPPASGALAESIASELRARGIDPMTVDRTSLKRALAEQVRNDFAEGRLVRVDGWVLARTEAQLCGLVAQRAG